MQVSKVKSITDDLKIYDYLAKDSDFIQVTRWVNGEGCDITINDKIYSFTDGQLDAIRYLNQTLMYDDCRFSKKN